MDPVLIVVGVVFLVVPFQYRFHITRLRKRLMERGGDVGRFDRMMGQWWISASVIAAPLLGVVAIVLGLTA